MRKAAPTLALLVLACGASPAGTDTSDTEPTTGTTGDGAPLWADQYCDLANPSPYPPSGTYMTNHAGRENANAIPCAGPRAFDLAWHVLPSHASGQPNTFSPDGGVAYFTSTTGDDGCNVFAVDADDGAVLWKRCDLPFTVIASTVDVDENGDLYLTAGDAVHALRPADGRDRWRTPLPDTSDVGFSYGLKFTADGHIVTQVADGTVYLLDRTTGTILTSLSVADVTGFVPAEATELPIYMAPDYILARLHTLVGDAYFNEAIDALSGLLGASGGFADNTVCTTARRQVLTVGGGPNIDTGAAVALDISGPVDAPSLQLRWALTLTAGTASSVVASSDGARAVLGDGNGHVHMIDVPACDNNTDGDADPLRCAPAWVFKHPGGRLLGTVALDAEGVTYVFTSGPERVEEIYALNDQGDAYSIAWQKDYGPLAMMTSVLTVTDDAIYGVLSQVDPAAELDALTLPASITSEVVVIDKKSGEIVHRATTPESSLTELVLSPRGDLFLTTLGVYEILTLDESAPAPVGGLRKFTGR
jgi:outer membrane protein assembly factor BamB